jgi:zinc transporter
MTPAQDRLQAQPPRPATVRIAASSLRPVVLPVPSFPLSSSDSYGADASGLVCGYRFMPGGAGRPTESQEAAAWIAGAGNADAFLWLHFNLTHTAAERWLLQHAGLSETFFETLKEGVHSTRIERAEQSLVAVINDVRFDFSFEASDIATLWIHVDRRLIVTARRESLRSVDRLRTAVKRGETMRSPVELLEHLLRDQADVLVGIVRQTTSKIDDLEDELLAGRLDHKRIRLGRLRRLLVRLQRLLAPEPAALFRLLQFPPEWMTGEDSQMLRQSTEEFSVALRDMGALQERIKLLQEEIAAQVGEQNNRSLFVLTVVTVLALPINIMAGLFGMNVGGVPLSDHAHGFWIVVGIVVLVTAVAGWLAFRSKRDR